MLRLKNYPGYETPRHHGSSQLSITMQDEFHWSGAAVSFTVAYSTGYTSWLDDTSPFIVAVTNIIGRMEKQESGFSRFPGFPAPPWGDIQTKANMFCLIRTSFNWKEWQLLCSLYLYLFSKGLRISSILRGMQIEGRRRIDVNHTSQLGTFIYLSGSFSGFLLFHTPTLSP